MSYVTNLLVTTLTDKDGSTIVKSIQSVYKGDGGLPIDDDLSFGTKSLECSIWAGAFNCHIDYEVLKRLVSSLSLQFPEDVQIFAKEQDDNHFSEVYP